MYEAMRQRAPFSTRIVGVAATVVLGAAGGYVLLSGFGDIIVKSVQKPMTVVSLAPPARPVDPPPAKFDKIDDVLDVVSPGETVHFHGAQPRKLAERANYWAGVRDLKAVILPYSVRFE